MVRVYWGLVWGEGTRYCGTCVLGSCVRSCYMVIRCRFFCLFFKGLDVDIMIFTCSFVLGEAVLWYKCVLYSSIG